MTAVIVDFHNHLVPGVDDGAADAAEAKEGLRAMRAEGVGALIVTPHMDASLTCRAGDLEARLAELDAGWETLVAVASAEEPGLRLERGVELKLDTPELDLSDPRLRLAGTRFVLVEFPHLVLPPHSAHPLSRLRDLGWIPVVAHPERYAGIEQRLELLEQWRDAGAYLQVNHGSFFGRYGRRAQQVASILLERGWIDYLSSDFHARGTPRIQECRGMLLEMGGAEHAQLLMETNPRRLLDGEPPLPVPPLRARRGLWSRIAALFR